MNAGRACAGVQVSHAVTFAREDAVVVEPEESKRVTARLKEIAAELSEIESDRQCATKIQNLLRTYGIAADVSYPTSR